MFFPIFSPTYYEMTADDHDVEKQKSSGICVSTGTGSTAWSHNICNLHRETLRKIIDLIPGLENRSDDLIDKSELFVFFPQFSARRVCG